MRIYDYIRILFSLTASLLLFSCADIDEPDYREKDYGYVQFKLYKDASYVPVKAGVDNEDEKVLDFLFDATKVRVELSDPDSCLELLRCRVCRIRP